MNIVRDFYPLDIVEHIRNYEIYLLYRKDFIRNRRSCLHQEAQVCRTFKFTVLSVLALNLCTAKTNKLHIFKKNVIKNVTMQQIVTLRILVATSVTLLFGLQ